MIRLCINVQLLDFDTCIRESVVKNEDDSYTVFINARLSQEKQKEVYQHAIKHIKQGDFEKENADQIELETHGMEISVELCGIA